MQANSLVVVTKENLVDLFGHECIRVFNDRLISKEDNELFYLHLCETVMDYFKIVFKSPYKNLVGSYQAGQKPAEPTPQQPQENADAENGTNSILLYGDFMKNDDRIYQPLNNWKQLVSILSEYQMRSNMTGHATKQIVFFKEAVEHVCRACRVLRQAGGHMLLVGLDGTGKSTIMELSSYISNCEMRKLNVKKGYNYSDFRDDLKSVFKLTGIQKKRIVFFVSDRDIYEVSLSFNFI